MQFSGEEASGDDSSSVPINDISSGGKIKPQEKVLYCSDVSLVGLISFWDQYYENM